MRVSERRWVGLLSTSLAFLYRAVQEPRVGQAVRETVQLKQFAFGADAADVGSCVMRDIGEKQGGNPPRQSQHSMRACSRVRQRDNLDALGRNEIACRE
jgi:hypothetical protein